uniref:Uncharacterized protein n=1 Tax=Lutzomyia longipalpis TaxID=7200 RepID=A0A1B0C847_LUTLO
MFSSTNESELHSGETKEWSNYRPINVLPVLAKILEAVVAEQINRHLDIHDIMTKHQYGFRRNSSTMAALNDLVDDIQMQRDNGNIKYKLGIIVSCRVMGRPKRCNNPKVCNLWHKSGVRYMRTCQPCPDIYPWTGKTGIRSSRVDNEIEE